MDGILIALGEMGIRCFFLSRKILRTGFDIPVLRLFRDDSKYFYAGPGVSIPAVNDFLADPQLQLVSESSYNFEEIVFRYSGFKINPLCNQNGDQKILQVRFRCQHFSTRIDIAMHKNIVRFVTFSARNALKAEERFTLKVEVLELVEVGLAILARLGAVRITHYAWGS
jgi:hypothetical protein